MRKKKPEKKNTTKTTTTTTTTTTTKDVNPHTFAMPVQRFNQLRISGFLITYLHFATALAES